MDELIEALAEEINMLKLHWQMEEDPFLSRAHVLLINSLTRIRDALIDAK